MTTESKMNRITRPGKFEGEPTFVPYFWDAILEGSGDEDFEVDGCMWTSLAVNPEDVARFPELHNIKLVALSEDSQGFVTYCAAASGYNGCIGCDAIIIDDVVCDDCREGREPCERCDFFGGGMDCDGCEYYRGQR
jgi:hypothetical protein